MKDLTKLSKIDLHIHTSVSDGTDTPMELLSKVREAGLELFAVTDHDAISGAAAIHDSLSEDDPCFIPGIEFSCKDEDGKYHILGYGYDPASPVMKAVMDQGHQLRVKKMGERLDALRQEYGISFSDEEVRDIYSQNSPGKPHIAALMVKHGYANSISEAIKTKLNRLHVQSTYIRPETAITAILGSGGIPVLAHPPFGSGDELILGEEMENRLRKLMGLGIQGVEGYYSGFTDKLQAQMLDYADRFGLYVTAGSDYHGTSKMIPLGDTNLPDAAQGSAGLRHFLEDVPRR